MSTADIAYWAARVAELERELDAAKKLSEVNLIASELMRTKTLLKKSGHAGSRPTRRKVSRAYAAARAPKLRS